LVASSTVIFSSSKDRINYDLVAGELRDRGRNVLDIRFDDVLGGRQRLEIEVSQERCLVRCGDECFDPSRVASAWWRKPQWLRVERDDPLRAMSLELELERTHLTVASLIPEQAWLNSPDTMRHAESKLRQLSLAAQLGFHIPATSMGNRWPMVRRLAEHGDVVFKTLRGGLTTRDENQMIFTTRLDHARLDTLEAEGKPWPGMFQAYVSGRREWRVTVVGDEVFSVAIYLDGDGLVDWRKHQLSDAVRFTQEPLAHKHVSACRRLVRALNLRFAALDLIEARDGTMYFLEANPNGQYGWLEKELDIPISTRIAAELL
jgi:glutathione synthase/RimK-type ligase-like ATP-grasp enzyme